MKSRILMIALTTLMINSSFATLTGFTGQYVSSNTVDLKWNTMVEINTACYEIQRSSDGIHFDNIGKVNSLANESTNVYQLNYEYIDATPLGGISFYRLEIVGKDGKTSNSDVITVSGENAGTLKIFPTLMQGTNLFVQSEKEIRNVKLEIYDLSGKKMGESCWETLSGSQLVGCTSRMHMASGTYLARLTSNGQKLMNQLIIVQSH
jgi:hypothetical protein